MKKSKRKVDKSTGEIVDARVAKVVAQANDEYFDADRAVGQEALIPKQEVKLPPPDAREYEFVATIKIRAAVDGAKAYTIPITDQTFKTPGRSVSDALCAAIRGKVFRRAIEGVAGRQVEEL